MDVQTLIPIDTFMIDVGDSATTIKHKDIIGKIKELITETLK